MNDVDIEQLPIDHDDPSVGTYENRYWVNDQYYQRGGPVFVYDVGEASAEASAKHLCNSTSFLVEMLDDFGAIGIVWEHRSVLHHHLFECCFSTLLSVMITYQFVHGIDTTENHCPSTSARTLRPKTSNTSRTSKHWPISHSSPITSHSTDTTRI